MSDKLPTLTELQRLEKEATPGPWNCGRDDMRTFDAFTGRMQKFVYRPGDEIGSADIQLTGLGCNADAALIAALRNAAPHLLAIAEAYHQMRQAWEPPACGWNEQERERVDEDKQEADYKLNEAYSAARAAGLFGDAP